MDNSKRECTERCQCDDGSCIVIQQKINEIEDTRYLVIQNGDPYG